MNVSDALTPLEALKIIGRDHPEFRGQLARWLENGWDNRVLEVDDEFIFRFPRDDDFPSDLELRVLERVRGKVKTAIPAPRYFGNAPRYMGYEKIQGAHWTDEEYAQQDQGTKTRLAEDIAAFLWGVRGAAAPSEFVSMGLHRQDWRLRLALEIPVLERLNVPGLCDFVRAVQADYEAWEERERDFVLLFNDLHAENMLLDESFRLAGVIDFGDVAYGDVHWDFRYLFLLTEDLQERAMAAYETLSGERLERGAVRLCGIVQELCDFALAHREPQNRVPIERTRARVHGWIRRGPELWRRPAI